MAEPKILRIYLDDDLRQSAKRGTHNFLNKISTVVRAAGYRVEYLPDTASNRLKATRRHGYCMFHMDGPMADRSLIFRRVYSYPFWAIEPSPARWQWRVAQSTFEHKDVSATDAEKFFGFWKNRLFNSVTEPVEPAGFIFIPLQGKLLDHRSFQACSPLEMIRSVLEYDPHRKVIATLHPREQYSRKELDALQALQNETDRLTVQKGQMVRYLQACDYVVTQNSSAAFFGYFFEKPSVLFAQIDFHHIAQNVIEVGAQNAICAAPQARPEFKKYVYWFWQIMSINAGRPEAEADIRAALMRAGWPM